MHGHTCSNCVEAKYQPTSDQHQISPCNINAQLSAQVLRVKEMITRD